MRRSRAVWLGVLAAMTGSLLGIPAAGASTTTVDARDFHFSPQKVQVAVGDTVSWTNKDPAVHTVTADDGSFSMVLNPGETKSMTFSKDATVPYFCKLHGGPGGEGMSGTVAVGSGAPPTVKITGADNVARAIEWSKAGHPDGSAFALLGRSDVFADSLSSGAAQGKTGGPLLLTASNALDARTRAELDRLQARTVYIMGGTAAVSAAVETALRSAGFTVRRLAGSDRAGTAAVVADHFFPEATSALLLRAFGPGTSAFADALAAGALAAQSGQPVLLSNSEGLSAATKTYLQTHPISRVSVIGGEAALSAQIDKDLAALKIESERMAGADRSETAAHVAAATAPHDEPAPEIVLVDGNDANGWADGFAAAGRKSPVLLTSGDTIPGATASRVAGHPNSTALVCGATVTATACTRSEIVRSAEIEFPTIGAFVAPVAGADPKSGGASGIYRTSDPGTLCYDYFGSPLPLTAAHIHRKSDSSPVIPMTLQQGDDDNLFGCTFGLAPAVVADVIANPGDYYVNLHTAQFPNGAASGPISHLDILFAEMVGDAEVPGPGDPKGAGFAIAALTDTPGQLCSAVFSFGLDGDPTAAHIHTGKAGVAGPVAVPLPLSVDGENPITCQQVDQSLVSAIKATPGDYYVNVHTAKYPDGAIRGQLMRPTI